MIEEIKQYDGYIILEMLIAAKKQFESVGFEECLATVADEEAATVRFTALHMPVLTIIVTENIAPSIEVGAEMGLLIIKKCTESTEEAIQVLKHITNIINGSINNCQDPEVWTSEEDKLHAKEAMSLLIMLVRDSKAISDNFQQIIKLTEEILATPKEKIDLSILNMLCQAETSVELLGFARKIFSIVNPETTDYSYITEETAPRFCRLKDEHKKPRHLINVLSLFKAPWIQANFIGSYPDQGVPGLTKEDLKKMSGPRI